MEGRPWRTRLTLSDLLAVQHSSNLRDLLGYREEEEEEEDGGHQAILRRHGGDGGGEILTLASALAYEKGEASSTPTPDGRTLLDIFRNDESGRVAVTGRRGGRTLLDIFREDEGDEGPVAGGGDSIIWRTFEGQLHGTAPLTASSGGDPPAAGGAPPEEASAGEAADEAAPAGTALEREQPVRVSLMALLEETEGPMDGGGEVWAVAEEEEEEEMVAGEAQAVAEAEDRHVCCVCTERRKGAAFIPCGHTFCRVCSRVLFKRRGNCPLCNAQIVQVLRIF